MRGLVENFGENSNDTHFQDKSFPLLEDQRESAGTKVEIEDTETSEMRAQALEHLQTILLEILLSGAILWGVVVGFGLLAYAFPVCAKGSALVLLVTGALLLWRIRILTSLMSKTSFEGRPFVRFMVHLSGFDNYYALIAMALLDLSGKFTRALFVVASLHASTSYSLRFESAVGQTTIAFLAPVVRTLGLGGAVVASYIVGAVLIQSLLMLTSLYTVCFYLHQARAATQDEECDESDLHMGMSECLDDVGVLADWAMLGPVAKVFSLAAIPLEFEDENDAYRLWEHIRAEVLRVLVHILPDTIFSMYLQVILLRLIPDSNVKAKVYGALSILFSWASAMNKARNMLRLGHVLPVTSALVIIFLGLFPAKGAVRAFICMF